MNKSLSKNALKALEAMLLQDGWRRSQSTSKMLEVARSPHIGNVHNILIWHPLRASELPEGVNLAFSCLLNVQFLAVEEFLESLGGDSFGRQTASIHLATLVPDSDLILGNSVPIRATEEQPDRDSLEDFKALIDEHLEPSRLRLSNQEILLDRCYFPPKMSRWPWLRRRLAYSHLHAGEEQYVQCRTECQHHIEETLAATADSPPRQGFMLSRADLAALAAQSEREGALETRLLIDRIESRRP